MMKDSSTLKYIFQVKFSLIAKALAILLYFISTFFILKVLSVHDYGFWATLIPLSSWLLMFDFGVLNSIKNNLIGHIARGDINSYRKEFDYAAGTMLRLTSRILLFGLIVIAVLYFYISSYYLLCLSVFLFFSTLNIGLSLVKQLYHSKQESAYLECEPVFIYLGICISSVVIVFFDSENNLLVLISIFGLLTIGLKIFLYLFFFYRHPELKIRRFNYLSNDYRYKGTAFHFFILQLSALILNGSDRLIISNFIGLEYTAEYDVIYRFASVFLMIHAVLNAPLWPIYGREYQDGNRAWIIKKYNQMSFIVVFFGGVFMITSFFIPHIAILIFGGKVAIEADSWITSVLLSANIVILCWCNNSATIVNSISKIKYQVYCIGMGAIFNIPFSIVLASGYGVNGVIISTILCLMPWAIIGHVQVKKEFSSV
ncbi:lipopolysaccharide biosynthesis protein [Aeromonas veronii]